MSKLNRYFTYAFALRERRTKLQTGRTHSVKVIQDTMGQIYFVLLTEMGLDVWPNREFMLRGLGVNVNGRTDNNGEFKHAPVEFGEYELIVGDATFQIPAITVNSPPHPVHIPYTLLPDQLDWDGPTDEEINETDLD